MNQLKKTLLLLSLAALTALAHNAMAGVQERTQMVQPGSKCEGWNPGEENRFVLANSTILNRSNGNGRLDCGLITTTQNTNYVVRVGLLAIDNSTVGRVCARAIAYRFLDDQNGQYIVFGAPACTETASASPAAVLLNLGELPTDEGTHHYISVYEIARQQNGRRSGVHNFGAEWAYSNGLLVAR